MPNKKSNTITFHANRTLAFIGVGLFIMFGLLMLSLFMTKNFGATYNSSSAAFTCPRVNIWTTKTPKYCVTGIQSFRTDKTGATAYDNTTFYSGHYIVLYGIFPEKPATGTSLPVEAYFIADNVSSSRQNLEIKYYSTNQINIFIPTTFSTTRKPPYNYTFIFGSTRFSVDSFNYRKTISVINP